MSTTILNDKVLKDLGWFIAVIIRTVHWWRRWWWWPSFFLSILYTMCQWFTIWWRRWSSTLTLHHMHTTRITATTAFIIHPLLTEYFSEDFMLVSEIHSRQRLCSDSSTDVVVPATRRSSLGDHAFPVASTGMEHVTVQCHLQAVPLFILATSENFSIPAITASVTLISV